jgi:hypothetical protein
MDEGIFVPFIFFAFLGAVIIVPIIVKERTKRSAHDLISRAMERGQTLEPGLVAQLTQNMLDEGNRARRTLGRAVILIALAIGFVGMGFVANGFDDSGDAQHGMLMPAVLLGTVGLAFLLLAAIDYATKKREPSSASAA